MTYRQDTPQSTKKNKWLTHFKNLWPFFLILLAILWGIRDYRAGESWIGAVVLALIILAIWLVFLRGKKTDFDA